MKLCSSIILISLDCFDPFLLEVVSKTLPEIFGIVIYNSSISWKLRNEPSQGGGKKPCWKGKTKSCRTVFLCGSFCFFLLCSCVRRQFRSALFCPRKRLFLPAVFVAAALLGFPGNGRPFFRKVVLYPRKKHQNTGSAIYSTVSSRFYNVFYKKVFTNEF